MSFANIQHPATHARSAGFTLIELLVASLLMGMLVTILTMVFNASSIAWRTGKAGVREMNVLRQGLAIVQRQAENALPHAKGLLSDNTMVYVAGPWDDSGNLRQRSLLDTYNSSRLKSIGATDPSWQKVTDFKKGDNAGTESFAVGVWSAGPDRKWGTSDDISSWPEDEE